MLRMILVIIKYLNSYLEIFLSDNFTIIINRADLKTMMRMILEIEMVSLIMKNLID